VSHRSLERLARRRAAHIARIFGQPEAPEPEAPERKVPTFAQGARTLHRDRPPDGDAWLRARARPGWFL
jgi:hypothetical protein